MKAILKRRRGFTLIELLIVIGILGILVVAVLLTLNPAAAQRKARDAKRMKDLTTMQATVDQYLTDGGVAVCTAVGGCVTNVNPNLNCNSGWIAGANLCEYITQLPNDPNNGATRAVVNKTPCTAPITTANVANTYRVRMSAAGTFEVDVVQEDASGCQNAAQDAGNNIQRAEAGSDKLLLP